MLSRLVVVMKVSARKVLELAHSTLSAHLMLVIPQRLGILLVLDVALNMTWVVVIVVLSNLA